MVHSGSAAVTNCLFEGNTVGLVADQGEGGGVWLGHDDDPTCPGQHQSVFTDCVFRGNHSLDRGGGVFGDQKSTPRFDGCTFDNNTADLAGAGAYMKANVTDNDTSTFTSCIFSNNTAMGAGGGLFARRGTITDCTFTENSASTGAGIYALQPGPLVVEASIFVRNATIGEDNNGGGGIYANTAGTIRTSLFRENTTGGNGGGLYNLGFQFTVTDCSFIENNARLGGGVLMYFGEIKNLTNCRFRGNTALTGGGAYVVSGEPTFVNCEFNRNRATEFGGGILFNYNHSRLINCTLYGNTATTGGGVYTQFGTSPATSGSILVDNSILWNNSDEAGTTLSSQIFPDLVTLPVVNYSDVQGWDGSFGGGNNNTNDPLFVDPDGADNIPGTEDDNLRLSAGSSSIDTADNSAVPSGLTTDLDGNPRIENGTVDMGAYERGVCVPLFEFEVVCDDAQDDDCDTLTDCDDSDCANDPACATTGIPTVSQWGVVAMSLLTLTAGTLVFSRKETHTAC